MKVYAIAILGALALGVSAHMMPETPCPRGSPLESCNYPEKDYSLKSPISTDGVPNAPLCHHTTPYSSPVATYKAGESIPVKFAEGGATHGGGHCEFSLSYDGGETFVAIQTILKTCFTEGLTFSVPIPEDAPSSDKVVFAWSWVNAVGNREFYMTCSDIAIEGKDGGSISGPPMLHPNYGDGPTIGEFGYGGDDGSDYYKNRPTIVISASGASTTSSGSNNNDNSNTEESSSAAADDNNNSASVDESAPSATDSAAPVETSAAARSDDISTYPSCQDEGKSGVIVVNDNGREVTGNCPAGLVCKSNEGVGAYCAAA